MKEEQLYASNSIFYDLVNRRVRNNTLRNYTTSLVVITLGIVMLMVVATLFSMTQNQSLDLNYENEQLPKFASLVNILPHSKLAKEKRLILFWSEFSIFNSQKIAQELIATQCDVTFNRSEASIANVIVFPNKVVRYPVEVRSPEQLWVYSRISPQAENTSQNVVFNLTATYSLNSTVPIKPFQLYKENMESNCSNDIASTKTIQDNKLRIVLFYNSEEEKNLFSKKVNFLRKLDISIDTYGYNGDNEKCTTKTGANSLRMCLKMISNKYKFYLSLEDWFCPDYISKRFYRAIQFNLIPIVWGGAPRKLYEEVAPFKKSSFININDFTGNFTGFRKHLEYVNNNNTAFNQYFSWKSSCYNFHINYNWFSRLCNMTLKLKNKVSSATFIDEWNESKCTTASEA